MESRVRMPVRRGLTFAALLLLAWTTSGCATIRLLEMTSRQSVQPERIDAAGRSGDQVAIWYKASRSNLFSHAVESVHRYALLDRASSSPTGTAAVAFPIGDLPPGPAGSPASAFVNIPVLADATHEALVVALETNPVLVVGTTPAQFSISRRSASGAVEEVPCRIPASRENDDAQSDLTRVGGFAVGVVVDAAMLTAAIFFVLLSSPTL